MKIALIVCAAASVVAASAGAQPGGAAPASSQRVAAAVPTTDGVVRKVDREQGKLTLQHGRIENLGMPGMTMVFKAASPKLLDGLKEGDKVKFAADNVKGVLTVTAVQTVK